jgi:hypothetical protein
MAKNISFIVAYIYILAIGLISWHSNDKFLVVLFVSMMLLYVALSIFFKKYLFLLIFVISYIALFTLSYNPYMFYVVNSGVVKKEIHYESGAIYVIKFLDNSTVTVVYGEDKQCFGGGYEGKYSCRMILSKLDNYVKTGQW